MAEDKNDKTMSTPNPMEMEPTPDNTKKADDKDPATEKQDSQNKAGPGSPSPVPSDPEQEKPKEKKPEVANMQGAGKSQLEIAEGFQKTASEIGDPIGDMGKSIFNKLSSPNSSADSDPSKAVGNDQLSSFSQDAGESNSKGSSPIDQAVKTVEENPELLM